MNMRLILNGYLIQHHKRKSNGDSCLCGWIKSEVNRRALHTPDELLASILDAATRIKKREDQLR
jgi:hypothetical protein